MPTIHISSFSYHANGIPRDDWGHRGGFVFDCRCLPNPGRLDEYKTFTGRDPRVIAYLERQPVVGAFLQSASSLVDIAVASYQDRGFEHLTVAFGCTGGQHRSVYCAEWLRRRLSQQGHEVTIHHIALPETEPAAALPAP